MTNAARARDARTYASIIRHYITAGMLVTASKYLQRYYLTYGNTAGYRKLSTELTVAASKTQIG